MTSVYNFYPGIDQDGNFSPVVRTAFAASIELAVAMANVLPPLLVEALSDNPEIHDDLIAKITALTLGDLNLLHKNDIGIPTNSDYDGYAWLILDPSNAMAIGILDDGTVVMPRMYSGQWVLSNKALEPKMVQEIVEENEYSWAYVDVSGNISELCVDKSGRIPDVILSAWADRMNWSSDDVAAAIADALADYQPGLEIGSIERNTDYSTTATASGTKIPGLVLDITGAGRPVDLEFRLPNSFHSVANTGVNAGLYVNGTQVQADVKYSPQNTKGPSLSLKQRVVLLDGIDYTIDVDMWGNAAGTCTMDVDATKPAYLTATNR